MFKVFIKTEGGKDFGFGHIMRCISLGNELRKNNFEVTFLINFDRDIIEILKFHKFNFNILENEKIEIEIDMIKQLIKNKDDSIIVTDSYHMSNDYLRSLRNLCKYLISLDDLNLYDYPSNIVINSNVFAYDLKYKRTSKTKYLLGGRYIIFRDEFINSSPINIKRKCDNILITMGGTDLNNFTLEIIRFLKDIKDVNLNIVLGPGFKNKIQLINEAYNLDNVNFIDNPKSMVDIMKENDIAISSASTTSYELALLGIPSILIIQVDNQAMVANKMDELGAAINLGWFYNISQEKLCNECENLIKDYEKRKKISEVSQKLVNRYGVESIVKEINKLEMSKG